MLLHVKLTNTIYIHIYVHINRTGNWKSEWKITIDSQNSIKMSYSINVLVHYFEEGNVQLNTSTSGDVEIKAGVSDDESKQCASAIVNEIRKVEKQYLVSLEVYMAI